MLNQEMQWTFQRYSFQDVFETGQLESSMVWTEYEGNLFSLDTLTEFEIYEVQFSEPVSGEVINNLTTTFLNVSFLWAVSIVYNVPKSEW